ALVDEEHQLRGSSDHTIEQRTRLHDIEVALDQAWDLLRRREAAREAGKNPDEVEARPASQVESYLQ
ncbi:MAG: DUF2630 family protein, partial [Frankiaceae bacterium]|nr:DUF2630 family protein [Frankiaceae bacterium]